MQEQRYSALPTRTCITHTLYRGDYSQGMTICDSPLVSVIGLLQPRPCPMKLTCRYIFYVELYSGVVLFSLIFRVRVRVRVRYRVRVRVRV